MVHPAPDELVQMPCLAIAHFDVRFLGKEAHASAFPELGVNAADAVTIAQVSVGLLRQHAKPGDQVHGIVTNGGAAPNIVPGLAEAKYYVRSATLDGLAAMGAPRPALFRGRGPSHRLLGRVHHPLPGVLGVPGRRGDRRAATAPTPSRSVASSHRHRQRPLTASTDMANISLAIPAIHPTLDIGSAPAVNHQPEFAAHCVTPAADRAVLDGATAMAWTVIDLALDRDERERLLRSALRRSLNPQALRFRHRRGRPRSRQRDSQRFLSVCRRADNECGRQSWSYSAITISPAFSPHAGQAGSRRNEKLRNSSASAS